jgi:hypothetical protein
MIEGNDDEKELTTTLTEAERAALAYARDFITGLPKEQSALRDLIGMSPLDPMAGRKLAMESLKWKALQDEDTMTLVVDLARAGVVDAQRALDDIEKDSLHANVLLPPSLADYIIRGRADGNPARSKTANILIDAAMAAVVYQLTIRFGLKPTRNRAFWGRPYRLSSCAVTSTVFNEAKVRRTSSSEGAAEKVWQRLGPRLAADPPPPSPGALTRRDR